ncbi:hypothetical protein EON81_09295 [bacterium]|nr:MAG: hypothetical protein EON81_09295 [bacterium]
MKKTDVGLKHSLSILFSMASFLAGVGLASEANADEPPLGTTAQCQALPDSCPSPFVYQAIEKKVKCCCYTDNPQEFKWCHKIIRVYKHGDVTCYKQIDRIVFSNFCVPVSNPPTTGGTEGLCCVM